MKRFDFNINIAKYNIPENWFLINKGCKEDAFCLEEVYGKWCLYYFEKGNRENEQIFDYEEDALELLFNKLLSEKKLLDSMQ